MHSRALDYAARYADKSKLSVIEIGSRYVNGGVRQLFPHAAVYLGLDIASGKGVDVVCDAAEFTPDFLADVVISTEVLEHTLRWDEIVLNAAKWLKPNGRMVITCAGPHRPVHSAIGGAMREDEHYMNIDPVALYDVMWDAGLHVDSLELYQTDTRASGVKS